MVRVPAAIQGSAIPCTFSESLLRLHSVSGLQTFATHNDCALELNAVRRLQASRRKNLVRRESSAAEFLKHLKVTVAACRARVPALR